MFASMTNHYFTSDSIKSYIINEIKPLNKDIFYDPACGSGGFIEYALNYIRQNELSHLNFIQNVHANDQDKIIYELLKSNMTNNRISLNNIKNQNSLDLTWNHDVINKFDCICCNPPFGMNKDIISCDNYWAPFNLNYNYVEHIIPRNYTTQFIMHIYNSLKYGGRCGVLVDLGLLFNGSDSRNSWQSKFRKYMLENTNLYKIVLLTKDTFEYTTFATCILFFVKGMSTQEIEFKNFDDNTTITKLSIDKIILNNYSLNYLNYDILNNLNESMIEIKVYQNSGELFRSFLINNLEANEIKLRKIFSDIPNNRLYKIICNNELIYTNMYDIEINTILSENLSIIFLDYDETMINNIRKNGMNLQHYPQYLNNIDIVKFAVNLNGYVISSVSDALQNDYDVVKLAVKSNGASLKYLSENYRYDPNIVKLAVQSTISSTLRYTSNDIKDDYDIVRLAIQQNGCSYSQISTRLQNNNYIIKLAMISHFRNDRIYNLLSDELKNHPEIAKFAIILNCVKLQQLSEHLRDDLDIVKSAIEIKSNNLEYASESLRDNLEIVKLAVQKDGCSLQYASERLQDEVEIVKLAVQKDGCSLQYASERLQDKVEIVKLAVQNDGLSLQYASERLQDEVEIVELAVKNKGLSLQYASDSLKDNLEIVKLAVMLNPTVLQYVSNRLADNLEIVKKAVLHNGLCLQYSSYRLRNEVEIVKLAVIQNGLNLQYASDRLRDDIGMVKRAILNNTSSLQYASNRLRNDIDIVNLAVQPPDIRLHNIRQRNVLDM